MVENFDGSLKRRESENLLVDLIEKE